MKNPIKNGKEVFAVLSMATVMSISMSVKVDAASGADGIGSSTKVAAERTVNESKNDNNTESPTSKEEVSSSQDTKKEGKKDTEATKEGSSDVTGDISRTKDEKTTFSKYGEEKDSTLELGEENVNEPLGSTGESENEANGDKFSSISERNVEGKDGQVEATEVNGDKVSTNSEGNVEGKDRESEALQDKNAENSGENNKDEKTQEDSNLGLSNENPAEAQQAEPAEPNYSTDEKEIKDYSGSERYKETDLQPGDTIQESGKADEKKEKDGLKFELKNPSATSPSKREYGWQVTIDKETGQRTYTKITVTDSGLVPVKEGEKPMLGKGDKLTPESPDVSYKPTEDTIIDKAGRQFNLNYEATEETLKHINHMDNDSTSFGFEDNYTKDNPGVKFFGNSFALGYKVNPWPNENDKLEELKLNKNDYDPTSKYFVQGQDIDTGIKIDNVDENAKERLVGQVYNPNTGKIVPGARAFIDEGGKVKIQMPEGALKLEGGKYVVNENSIFAKDPEYKGLTYLDVKFFARPRTKGEFENVANSGDEYSKGTYVETGAGTADINHKGTNVTIDKQGIDRYDHYNILATF